LAINESPPEEATGKLILIVWGYTAGAEEKPDLLIG
jgi:hypothetical protein